MLFRRIKNKLVKFLRLSVKMKLLVVSAFCLSGAMRLLILLVPFKKLASLMGKEGLDSPRDISSAHMSRALKVGWAVNTICSYTPWESKCYVKALTAQFILRTLRIPATVYLGVAKNGTNSLCAHAWLRCGNVYLTGENEMDRFKCLTYFSTQYKSA